MPHDPTQVTLLALDVDGVLTDGSVHLDDRGQETKRFNIRDGFGLRLWQRLGFRSAVITGRSGASLQYRAAELGIADVIQGAKDKSASLDTLIARTGIPAEKIAYVGDDWPDLCVLRRVGYPIAVHGAEPEVLEAAAFVTMRPGGEGAVRDIVEHLLRAKGLFEQALAMYR